MMRSFIDAFVEPENGEQPVLPLENIDAPVELDFKLELEAIKFKLTTYDSNETGEAAMGFDSAITLAINLIDAVINKLEANENE